MTNLPPVQGLSDERLAELLLWPFNGDARELRSLVSELQHRRASDGGGVAFVAEPNGLEVATFQPDAYSILELSKPRSGGFPFQLTVHCCNEETSRWSDLSIGLSRKDAERVSELLSASPPLTPANIEHVEGEVVASAVKAVTDCVEAIEYVAHNDIKAAGMKTIHELCGVALHSVYRLRAPQSSASGVRVKQLEWNGEESFYGAISVCGVYAIYAHDADVARLSLAMQSIGTYSSVEAAKAAAQSDYEARIKSSLVEQG